MNHKNKTAFTIIEVMMALVILAVLMAAVGLAFDASVKNYHANQGIYKTTNTARQALLRITNDIRTAKGYFDASNTYVRAIEPLAENAASITITLDEGVFIIYRFDPDTQTLYLDKDGCAYTLCENVTAMTFNGADCSIDRINAASATVTVSDTRNVRVIMTLTDDLGKVTQTLAAGAVVRKNL